MFFCFSCKFTGKHAVEFSLSERARLFPDFSQLELSACIHNRLLLEAFEKHLFHLVEAFAVVVRESTANLVTDILFG